MDFDFDFDELPVPFRMQPGLRKVDQVPLTPLIDNGPLFLEKQRVVQLGQSRLAVPGFDAGPALRSIATLADKGGHCDSLARPLELRFEEDFAVLDAATGTLPWLCVCVPSHWAPEEKLGLHLAQVHAPVADNSALQAASHQLIRLVTSGESWQRSVCTVSPSGRFDQHPYRNSREPWPAHPADADPADFVARLFLRVERQSFIPILTPDGSPAGQAVFTIRVMLERLTDAVTTPAKASRLHDWLASMSPPVLDYKNLTACREPVLAWLGRFASTH
ncbi:MAG: heme-dependent oxidative N-demethylase subunit alpha family protein [Pseudomonadota bacterium]